MIRLTTEMLKSATKVGSKVVIASEPESKGAIAAIFLGFVVLYNLAGVVKIKDDLNQHRVGNALIARFSLFCNSSFIF
jgi:hypothetical protein